MRAQMFAACLRGARSRGTIVSISDATYSDTEASPDPASVTLTMLNDGTGSGGFDSVPWLVGGTNGSAFEVRATVTSGSLSSGTTGSWLALSATRSWTVTRSSLGGKTCTFTLEVRDAATQTVQDTASITLTAIVVSGA